MAANNIEAFAAELKVSVETLIEQQQAAEAEEAAAAAAAEAAAEQPQLHSSGKRRGLWATPKG